MTHRLAHSPARNATTPSQPDRSRANSDQRAWCKSRAHTCVEADEQPVPAVIGPQAQPNGGDARGAEGGHPEQVAKLALDLRIAMQHTDQCLNGRLSSTTGNSAQHTPRRHDYRQASNEKAHLKTVRLVPEQAHPQVKEGDGARQQLRRQQEQRHDHEVARALRARLGNVRQT